MLKDDELQYEQRPKHHIQCSMIKSKLYDAIIIRALHRKLFHGQDTKTSIMAEMKDTYKTSSAPSTLPIKNP